MGITTRNVSMKIAACLVFLSFMSMRVEAAKGVRQLPLMWCVVEGSPTANDPAAVGALDGLSDATVSDVLWARHERASERIYIDATGITFRSALDKYRISDTFPVIKDPDTSSGNLGDIDFANKQEVDDARAACEGAWIDLLRNHDKCVEGTCSISGDSCAEDSTCIGINALSLPGIPVISANILNNCDCVGRTYFTYNPGEDISDLKTWLTEESIIFLVDRKHTRDGDADAELVAHELGHALGLAHTKVPGNILSTSSLTVGEIVPRTQLSTKIEDGVDLNNPPYNGEGDLEGSWPRTINQVEWVKEKAKDWPGSADDPPMLLIYGPTFSFLQLDEMGDVSEPYIDLSGFRATQTGRSSELPPVRQDLAPDVRFTHRVVGLLRDAFPGTSELNFYVLLDTDNDRSTGGNSTALPPGVPDTGFAGIEFIFRASVSLFEPQDDVPPAVLRTQLTAWQYEPIGETFQDVTDKAPVPTSFLTGGSTSKATVVGDVFEHVAIEVGGDFLGPLADVFRVQACAENPATGNIDCMNDSTGSVEGGRPYSLLPPDFPICTVTPAGVNPGKLATVEISGLDPNAPLHVILGDKPAATGITDEMGNATISFSIPIESRGGLRLVTAGIDGTALTADCAAEVSGALPLVLIPEVARSDPGTEQSVTALVRDEEVPKQGIEMTFLIESGPNAGASGSCGDCKSDENGMVVFTYQGRVDGVGVDKIVASFEESGSSKVSSNTARIFWDEDCNENAKADTCDLSCSGLNGECSVVAGCGGSLDEDGNGIPDECKEPPPTNAPPTNPPPTNPPPPFVSLTPIGHKGCMKVDGSGKDDDLLILGACDTGEPDQKFAFDGFHIRTALDESKCLQAGRMRAKDGKMIRVYPCDPDEPRQKFEWDIVNGGPLTLRDYPDFCVVFRGEKANVNVDPIIIKPCGLVSSMRRGWKVRK